MHSIDPDLVLPALAAIFGIIGAVALIGSIAAAGRRQAVGALARLVPAILLLCLAALLALMAVGIRGYRALVREEVAAVVTTEPLGPDRFRARFTLPDGHTETYEIAGDQLYVDARILKWKPIVNILGLHTSYDLDRVAGRYAELEAERAGERTVYALGEEPVVDLFELRREVALLSPLLDAEYGSATFVPAETASAYEIRVSTTGLLARPAGAGEEADTRAGGDADARAGDRAGGEGVTE